MRFQNQIFFSDVRIHDLDPRRPTFPYVSPTKVNFLGGRSKRQSDNYQLNVQPSQEHTIQLPGNSDTGIAGNITGRQFLASQQQNAGIPQNQQQYQPPQNLPVDQDAKYKSDLLKVHGSFKFQN